ncbi:hypothetical protein BJ165DRAFT_1464398 [Panaeolus papilionaceus]|nr:hypothetical protein BJ165DRAFT_1464398 [Panaeolus papilionaceus]
MSKNSLKRRRSGELGASTVESDGHLTSDPSAAIGSMASDSDDAQSEKPVLKRQKIPFRQVRNMDNFLISGMSGAEVYYLPSFVSPEKAKEWYSGLLDLDWYQPKLKIFGREVTQSRKITAYSTDVGSTLKYSGQIVDLKYDYPPLLRQIQDAVEERLGVRFNQVLLNYYEDGSVYIGKHRDHLENKVIACVSLGAERTFIMSPDLKSIRSHQAKIVLSGSSVDDDESTCNSDGSGTPQKRSWSLSSGSLVVMQGNTQKNWKHEIPKEPKVASGRISLTFRQIEK